MNAILNSIVRNKQVSVARFNDGEVGALLGDLKTTSREKQPVNESLISALYSALQYRDHNYYIGIPCPECFPEYYAYVKKETENYEHQLLATFATNTNYAYFKQEFLRAVKGKKILYIGGDDVKTDWIKNKGWDLLTVQNYDSFRFADKIINRIDSSEYNLYLFAVGAASRYLAFKTHQLGKSGLDIGSLFDPETRGVFLKPHKITDYKNEQKHCAICNF